MPFKKVRRSLKNFAYSDIEKKVREATNNDKWNPSSLLMSEIADQTNDPVDFRRIMLLIWQRLAEEEKQWRHIFKTLYLLEYLLSAGNLAIRTVCINHKLKFLQLRDFKFADDNGIDRGSCVRNKVESILILLHDEEAFLKERQKAVKMRDRCIGESSNMTSSALVPFNPSSSSSSSATTFKRKNRRNRYEDWKKRKNVEEAIEATEKFGAENALQLALALSEREMEEHKHVNEQDDEMLQMAIEESEKLAEAPIIDLQEDQERPFSPPPCLPSLSCLQEQSPPKINVIDEISNEIMALNFYEPIPPTSASSQPPFNDSFYIASSSTQISSPPSVKDFSDVFYNQASGDKKFFQFPLTPATPHSMKLPEIGLELDFFSKPLQASVNSSTPKPPQKLSDRSKAFDPFTFSSYDYDPFSAASSKSLITPSYNYSDISFGGFPAASAKPMQTSSSANQLPQSASHAAPESKYETLSFFDPFAAASAKPMQTSSSACRLPIPAYVLPQSSNEIYSDPFADVPSSGLSATPSLNTEPARVCTSSEAYLKMENDFRLCKLSSDNQASTIPSSSSQYHPQRQLSSTNPFLNDAINNDPQYSQNNPFVKDLYY